MPLPGLADWSASLEQVLPRSCKFMTETIGPMEGTIHRRHWFEIDSSVSETCRKPLGMFGPMAGTCWINS